jgi:type I restriction-modification system DNA methylase subunit
MAETWEKVSINTNVRSLVRDLKNAFRDFDSVYNSELFDKHECEEYDLSNDVLRETIDNLYEYNFGYLDADVLGSIYEDYIGHAIEEKGQGLDLVTQPDERREGGVYYTPVPVVEYIVESTVGERIENIMVDVREELNSENPDFEAARARFDEIQELKIVDVTCGSGSFLIKAYDLIVEAYQEFDELRKNVNGDMGVQQYSDALTIPDNYKKEILNNNIYGVDLDYQATEIATVNLLLKALDQGEKLPAILEDNIKNGNSLLNGSPEVVADTMDISVSEAEEIKAFDWESEFHDVFAENGGFDVIIGNPPWGADTTEYSDWLESDAALELAEGQYDTYELFLELGSELLNNSGTLGFIIPDTVINRDSSPLREWLVTEKKLDRVYKLGEGIFDNVFAGTSILQYTNTAPSADNEVQVGLIQKEDRKRMMGSRGEALSSILEEKTHTTRQSRFQDDSQHSIPVWAGEKDYAILDVMEENTVDWSNVIDNGRGDEIGRDGQIMQCPYCMGWDTYPQKRAESKGGGYYAKTCSHSDCGEEYEFEEAISTREIIKDTQTEECDTPVYFGEHINRYRVTDQAYIDQDVDGVGLKDDWRYTPPKLVIRQASVGFFATVDNTDARCLQAVFSFRPKNERDEPFDKYDIEYFLGFLNSRAMLYYYAKTEGITEWQSYPRHTQTDIMSLPVPEVDFTDDEKVEEYNEFVSLVRDAIGQNNNKVNQGLDWEIEEKVLDLYEIPDENRPRMWGELKKMQRLRILRELFPNVDDD